MKTRVVLADVAKLANTSPSAVSKVLNGGADSIRISPGARQRILDAAARLHYRPNMAASVLAGRRSTLVGLLLDTCAHFRELSLLNEIERQAAERGLHLMISATHDNPDAVRRNLEHFDMYGVTGVLCLSHDYPHLAQAVSSILESGRRVVFLEAPEFATDAYVATSRVRALTEMLADAARRGYRRPAVAFASRRWRSEAALEREFRAALAAAGFPVDETLCWEFPEEAAYDPALRAEWLLARCDRHGPDLLHLDDARTAVPLQTRLTAAGRTLRLVGGNGDPLFGTIVPGIPTLDPRYDRIAEELLRRVTGAESPPPATVESVFRAEPVRATRRPTYDGSG